MKLLFGREERKRGGRGELHESIVITYLVSRLGEHYMRFKAKGYLHQSGWLQSKIFYEQVLKVW